MGFFNYPFKKRGKRSFVRHEEVLQFYQSYANDHNLHRVIRFRNYVVNVRPLPEDRWQVRLSLLFSKFMAHVFSKF